MKVYGLAAAEAAVTHRLDDVLRVYLTVQRKARFAELLRHCARQRLPYRLVDDAQLQKISGSSHHQGICVVTRPIEVVSEERVLRRSARPDPQTWIYLDRVGNPHNFGAIARSAAHFGVTGILTPDVQEAASISGAALRTSEGGLEATPVARLSAPMATLERFRREQGFSIWATAASGDMDVWRATPPERLIWVMGTEVSGVSEELLRFACARVSIGGTGVVESLNVSTAAALCLGQSWRAHGDAKTQ